MVSNTLTLNDTTNIQVQSSLIVLTHPDTIEFLEKIPSTNNNPKLKLIKIADISGSKLLWGSGSEQIISDITFRFFILTFNKFVNINSFITHIKGGWFGGKLQYSIVNIQTPWSELRTTSTAPISINTNTITNPVINSSVIKKNGAYRIDCKNDNCSAIFLHKGKNETCIGKTKEAVRECINKKRTVK